MDPEFIIQMIKFESNNVVNSNISLIKTMEDEMIAYEQDFSDDSNLQINEGLDKIHVAKILKDLQNELTTLKTELNTLEEWKKKLMEERDELNAKLNNNRIKLLNELRNKILAHKLLTNVMFTYKSNKVSGYLKNSDNDALPFILDLDANVSNILWDLIAKK